MIHPLVGFAGAAVRCTSASATTVGNTAIGLAERTIPADATLATAAASPAWSVCAIWISIAPGTRKPRPGGSCDGSTPRTPIIE